jgi:hypothetical protein
LDHANVNLEAETEQKIEVSFSAMTIELLLLSVVLRISLIPVLYLIGRLKDVRSGAYALDSGDSLQDAIVYSRCFRSLRNSY